MVLEENLLLHSQIHLRSFNQEMKESSQMPYVSYGNKIHGQKVKGYIAFVVDNRSIGVGDVICILERTC